MKLTIDLDDELIRNARENSGLTDLSVLLNHALKSLIEREASRRLAELGGAMPDLEDIPRHRFGSEE